MTRDSMNRMNALLSAFSMMALVACADQGYSDDKLDDVEVDDAKADAWLGTYAPAGTYLASSPAAGEFTTITIKTDRTFSRSTLVQCVTAPCNPVVETGTYKITHGGASNYLRFLKADGSLLDRYSFEIHGRGLELRKVGLTDWQDLLIDDHWGSVTSAYAGAYTQYGTGTTDDGLILDMMLETTGQFYMTVHGVIACNWAGHSCPSSWSDGYTGWTDLSGTWSAKTGGVTLVPTDFNTGMTSPPIDLGIHRSGASSTVTGSIGPTQLIGAMTVHSLLNGSHSVRDSQLDGTWKFTADNLDAMDHDISVIEGYRDVVNGGTHMLTFDSSVSEAVEQSPNTNHGPHGFLYQVGGDPTGGSLGAIYFRDGTEFTVLRIKSKTSTKLVLRSFEDDFDFELEKQ